MYSIGGCISFVYTLHRHFGRTLVLGYAGDVDYTEVKAYQSLVRDQAVIRYDR